MSTQQALVPFLRALVAAKKSLALYPAGSKTVTEWIERLRRSLDDGLRQGIVFPIRVGRDRFLWKGGELLPTDATLKALRFDMQSRGIAELSIDPAVETWELQVLLEVLNRRAEHFASITSAHGYLRERGVTRVSVGAPGLAGLPAPPGHHGTGAGGGGTGTDASGSGGRLPGTDVDALELAVESVLSAVDKRFEALAYDRAALLRWLETLSSGDRVDRLYAAVTMLGAMAEGTGDREVRARTALEALMRLPDATLSPFFTDWLLPRAATDLSAFNLLTQVTEDELRQIARHVPRERLLALTTELLEYPWEEGKRLRLVEAITLTLERGAGPAAGADESNPLSPRDPLLAELRQEIMDACRPEALLARSADVLLALLVSIPAAEGFGSAVDALAELAREALAGTQPDLALRVLRTVATDTAGETSSEPPGPATLIRGKLAEPGHVSVVVALLRRDPPMGPMEFATEYLRLTGAAGVETFTALLATEPLRRVRIRMCEVLARLGPPAVASLLARLGDKRWFVVRNALYTLRKIGDPSAFPAAVGILEHRHPRVRLEAVRVAVQLGGTAARTPVLRRVHDTDAAVRRAAIAAVAVPGNDEAVAELRKILSKAAARTEDDVELHVEAIRALAAIGTASARGALQAIARRRTWFWRRAERRVRDVAAQTLRGRTPRARVAHEVGDDR